mgnify:CR=1 FL=1|jgi:serine/threonine protein kinase
MVSARNYRQGELIAGEFLVRRVMEGGLGIVYVVDHPEFGLAILKVPKGQESEEVREAFRREADLWVRLGWHPNIVQALRVDEIAGQVFVAAELVEPDGMGRVSLRDYLTGEPLPPNVAAAWSADFCYGLERALARGLVAHRDIKPDNLLIDASGVLRITDFGIAWTLRSEGEEATIAGTPPYMAPEQWRGAEQDVRTDLYAFGVVLYEMCYARMPFGGNSAADFRDQHLRARPVFSTHPFATVMARCLAKEPAARYQGPDELRAKLAIICGREGITLPPKPPHLSRDADDLHALAHALSAVGKHGEAIVAARRLVSLEPNDAGNWTQLARLLMEAGDELGAIDALDRSLTLDPTRSAPWNNLGLVFTRQGKWEHALAAFDRALVSDPRNTGALLNATTPLCQLGRHAEALDRLKRAAAIAPDKYMIWNNLGAVCVDLGRKADAIASFQKALALAPQEMRPVIEESLAAAQAMRG